MHGVRASRSVAIVVLVVLVIAAAAALPFLGGTFMPDFREGHFVMQVSSSVTGTSLDEMLNVGQRISEEVLALPYVQSIEQQVGRAELSEDTWGPHRSEFHVELKPDAKVDQSAAQEQLRGILRSYPGIQSEVVTFLGDRISESLSGETAQVAIKIFGDDLDALDRARRQSHRRARQGQGHRRSAVQAAERHPDDRHPSDSAGAGGHRAQGSGRARHGRGGVCGSYRRPDLSGHSDGGCRRAAAR